MIEQETKTELEGFAFRLRDYHCALKKTDLFIILPNLCGI